MNYKKLEKICSLCGSSGDEKAVREYIIYEIKDYADSYFTDPLGNLIVHKKGKQKPEKKGYVCSTYGRSWIYDNRHKIRRDTCL